MTDEIGPRPNNFELQNERALADVMVDLTERASSIVAREWHVNGPRTSVKYLNEEEKRLRFTFSAEPATLSEDVKPQIFHR